MGTERREHRTGHSGLVEPGHVLRQQPDQWRQPLRHWRRRSQRTAAGLHTRLRLQRLQHLLQPQGHSLARFLQRVLNGLPPFGLIRLPLCGCVVIPVPVVRDHAHQVLQRIAADTPDSHRQLKCQRIPISLHRLLPAIIQLPVLLDDLLIRHPVIRIRIIGIRRFCIGMTRTFSDFFLRAAFPS